MEVLIKSDLTTEYVEKYAKSYLFVPKGFNTPPLGAVKRPLNS
jgi:hypothetical protein